MGNSRNVEQQVGRSTKGGMEHHGIPDSRVREHVAGTHLELSHAQDRARRTGGRIQPDGLA